jgi:hypothetical protein
VPQAQAYCAGDYHSECRPVAATSHCFRSIGVQCVCVCVCMRVCVYVVRMCLCPSVGPQTHHPARPAVVRRGCRRSGCTCLWLRPWACLVHARALALRELAVRAGVPAIGAVHCAPFTVAPPQRRPPQPGARLRCSRGRGACSHLPRLPLLCLPVLHGRGGAVLGACLPGPHPGTSQEWAWRQH